MLKGIVEKKEFIFKEPGGTSRGVLLKKESYFISVFNVSNPDIVGVGECSILPKLSPDDRPELAQKLEWVAENINQLKDNYKEELQDWPAILFAVETAFLDLQNGGRRIYFESDFTDGKMDIPINGLIWMGEIDTMRQRIEAKLKEVFTCLKLKIGALDFNQEYELIKEIRNNFSNKELQIRLDANGAFDSNKFYNVVDKLKDLHIHSIEQPIPVQNWDDLKDICKNSPIDIALDEELIGINEYELKSNLVKTIKPQYIILKPSLVGGIESANEWIDVAKQNNVGWWITSALESNIGLNIIAQWTATLNVEMAQGLGTGQVFMNNVKSPLFVEKGFLRYSV